MKAWLRGGALALAALAGPATPATEDGTSIPRTLEETGLYTLGRPFSPQYPLWSDSAQKRRWFHLPAGATIDATRAHQWTYPVGTKFWKEFSFGSRKVETRMLWKASATRWVFASYAWNAAGTEALLAPPEGVASAHPLPAGRSHDIPSLDDCAACHGIQNPGPLGFNALQLSPDRDAHAIHGENPPTGAATLSTLVNERLLRPVSIDLLGEAPRIRSADPQARASLGYLLANCGSCHNGSDEISASSLVLKPEALARDADAVARALVSRPTRWQAPGVRDGATVLVDPVHTQQGAILTRMRSRSPSSQMPPLGTVLRDQEAVEKLERWMAGLAPR